MPRGKYLTAEQKAEIIRLRIDEGLPVWGITKKFGLCRDTVFKIIREWKKHGDSAISEEEIRNELDERAISEAADDDYVCYTVTGDTDIDAYMADRNEKKPDTVAAVTDSEQENLVDVPADIVSQPTENVKSAVPDAVKEACRQRIDTLRRLIDEEMAVVESWTAEIREITSFLEEHRHSSGDGGTMGRIYQ